MDAADAKDRRFWNRIAQGYARKPVADEAAYREKLKRTRAHLLPEMHILEIGCGTGSTALAHAPYVAQIDAIDLSDDMIRIAREKARDEGVTNVTFRQGDMADVTAPAGGYDAVLALSVLHLLRDRTGAVEKIHALLKPGGMFVSSTACLSDAMGCLKPLLAAARWTGRVPYVAFFTKAQLLEDMAGAGFQFVEEWLPGKAKAAFIIVAKPRN